MITRRHAVAAAAAALLLTVAATLLAGGAAPAAAHSTIAWPRPSRNTDCTDVPGRRGPGLCTGRGNTACPRTRNPWEAGRNFRRAGAVLRRGQSVTLRYMKNNHGPVGFVRWSLVPAKLHYNVAAHARFAFWWNCWGSGFRRCRRRGDPRGCGSDRKKEAWSSRVTIPTSIPDGNYILGFVWYGGGGENFGRLRFSAYWSCSFVVIRGGRQTRSWTPRFVPVTGRKDPKLHGGRWQQNNQCLSAVDRLGVCDKATRACKRRRVKFMKPFEFQGRRRPRPLTTQMYLRARK